MSGFDPARVNAEVFPDGKWKANFLCNLGYGDPSKLFPRNPRLEFDEACRVLRRGFLIGGDAASRVSTSHLFMR
jgi:hypothetical protein